MSVLQETGNYWNIGDFSDKTYDQQLAAIRAEMDPIRADQLFKQANVYALHVIYMLAFPSAYVYQFWWPWVKGYDGETCLGVTNTYGTVVARVWLDQALKKKMGR